MNLVIHPNYSQNLEAIENIISQFDSSGEIVVDGDRNVIKKFKVSEVEVNVKKFKTPNSFQALVYQFLRKSKARRSFEYARKLLEHDINTPLPIAYVENFGFGLKDSYYISEQLNYDLDFRVLNHNPRYPQREEILRQFTRFSYKMFEAGIKFSGLGFFYERISG